PSAWNGVVSGSAAMSRSAAARGSRRRGRSRSRSSSETDVMARGGASRRSNGLWRWAPVAALAVIVGACSDLSRLDRQASLNEPPKQAEPTGPAQREHQRILAAYGGAYHDARLEALIGKTVDRLVAASERPDLRYRVTILNSPAVNAFALPTGQLYVSRGL